MSAEVVDRGPAQRGTASPALFDALEDRYGVRSDRDAKDLERSQAQNQNSHRR